MSHREPIIIEKEEFDFRYILDQIKERWYFYVIAILFSMTAAWWYNQGAVEQNTLSTKILINVDEDQVVFSEDAITGLNFMFRAKTVNNEIAMLRSRGLVSRVLDSLDLQISYFQEGEIHHELNRDAAPYLVDLMGQGSPMGAKDFFTIRPLSDTQFELLADKQNIGIYAFGDVINHEAIDFRIRRNSMDSPSRDLGFYVNSKEQLLDAYVRKLVVMESDKDTDAITIQVDDNLPQRGKEFLDMLLKMYVLSMMEDRKRMARNTYDFISDRISLNSASLDSLERNIDQFKRKKSISEPAVEAQYILEGIKRFEIKLNDAMTQKEIVDGLVDKAMSRPMSQLDLSVPNTVMGVTDPLLNDLMLGYNRKQSELKALSKTVRTDNPLYQELISELDELRSSIILDLLGHQENMSTTVEKIESRIDEYKDRLAQLNFTEMGLNSLERIRDNKAELYVYLLKKREEAAMVLASDLLDTWIIERPHVSGSYYAPKKMIVLLIAFFVALFIPTSLILIWVMMDGKLRSLKDIKRFIQLPVLGSVSFAKGLQSSHVTATLAKFPHMSEQFKNLVFNMELANEEAQSIMVCSMGRGDGRTFTTRQLAYAYSSLGKKVCMVDLDLRSVQEKDGAKEEQGLYELLRGQVNLEEVIQRKPSLLGVDMIGAGLFTGDPTSLLVGDRIQEFVQELRAAYDIIIFDTPAMDIVSDATLIARLTDVNLLVLKHQHTQLEELRKLSEDIAAGRLKNAVLMLNAVKDNAQRMQSNYGQKKRSIRARIRHGLRKPRRRV